MSQKIKIESLINAPKENVWEYYTSPEHIVNWNFAHPSWHCPSAENEMKPGGKYKARMEAKDGSFGFDFEAEYRSINEGKNFVYVIADGREVEVDFENLDGKTRVTVVFEAEKENSIEMQKGGWQAILDNFKNYTESK